MAEINFKPLLGYLDEKFDKLEADITKVQKHIDQILILINSINAYSPGHQKFNRS